MYYIPRVFVLQDEHVCAHLCKLSHKWDIAEESSGNSDAHSLNVPKEGILIVYNVRICIKEDNS